MTAHLWVDLERHTHFLSFPSMGLLASTLFWSRMGLNAFADQDSDAACSRGVKRGNLKSAKAANHEPELVAPDSQGQGVDPVIRLRDIIATG
ncbi:hypothetical protein [Brevundimonas olei]|uniref:hypothetical protein n=1 Tax=Brevundimonas olei TaxID=657642 RepID=UPI0031DAB8B0